jgi:hypothetical protein
VRAIGRQFVGRLFFVLAVAVAAPAVASSAAFAGGPDLPQAWDPGTVAVNHEAGNTFLLRPGQILAGPGDAADVARALPGWRPQDGGPFGVTAFTRPVQNPTDPAAEVMAAIAHVRAVTAGRPQGPAKVAPNYVLVGEAASEPINFMGEPRVQGGPGSTARLVPSPATLPLRTTDPDDGKDVEIAVLDTGLFAHPWLSSVQGAPNSSDVWDADHDGYADAESGHGTFISGLILQVAPAASVYVAKVLDSHGVGDDFTVAKAMARLPGDVDIVNLSLGGYTDRDEPPMAIAYATRALGAKQKVVVSAAGNNSSERPFWPAAFEQVLGVGASDEGAGKWWRADYSNYGSWVDATARGSNLESTYGRGKTKVSTTGVGGPFDSVLAFTGWASWDGTSFSTPIASAMIARMMSRKGYGSAAEAQDALLASSPRSSLADFPHAVQLDELEGKPTAP